MYKLNQSATSITRLSDGASIPADASSIDFADYLRWLDEGPEVPMAIFISPECNYKYY